jgi:hypothetical protein
MTVAESARLLRWVNRWANSARSPVILFWPGSAESRRGNRYRFDDRRANLVTSLAPPPAQRLKSERRFPQPWSIERVRCLPQ